MPPRPRICSMRYRLAKVAPAMRSASGKHGEVEPGCVPESSRSVDIELVVAPIERMTPVFNAISGNDATGSGCGNHLSCTCSREEPDMISPPAACAVSYEI